MSFTPSDSEVDRSNRSGSNTHPSASPLNTIIPNEAELTTGRGGLILESVTRTEDDTEHHLDNVEDTTKVGSALFLVVYTVTPSLGVILEGAVSVRFFLYQVISYYVPPSVDLDLTRDHFLGCSRNQLSEDHKALQQVHLGCVRKEANLTKKLAAMEKERDNLLDKDREREERIKQLEADLATKTSSLTEAEGAVSTLKGDLERLTVDLSHAEIARHNYVRQLLPTVFQRLLSSDEYKKSLSDIFNLAIVAGWSEGVKASCSKEEAEAFLATAADYDPAYKTTFMSEFDSLFSKSYPYLEKLAESFQLLLGDLQNMWSEGTGPTFSGNAADMQ
ncbi:hypothetical protein Tco_1220818 [Tanacetum coccineum]